MNKCEFLIVDCISKTKEGRKVFLDKIELAIKKDKSNTVLFEFRTPCTLGTATETEIRTYTEI